MSLWKRGERVPDPAPAVHPNEIETLLIRLEEQFLNVNDREGRSACIIQVDTFLHTVGNTTPVTRDLLLDLRLRLTTGSRT